MPTLHLVITGRVQGVGFRYFTQDAAQALQLSGWVRNQADGSVEILAEGPEATLKTLIERLRQGPPLSRVEQILENWQAPAAETSRFSIR